MRCYTRRTFKKLFWFILWIVYFCTSPINEYEWPNLSYLYRIFTFAIEMKSQDNQPLHMFMSTQDLFWGLLCLRLRVWHNELLSLPNSGLNNGFQGVIKTLKLKMLASFRWEYNTQKFLHHHDNNNEKILNKEFFFISFIGRWIFWRIILERGICNGCQNPT
jgi:hypothetical protein